MLCNLSRSSSSPHRLGPPPSRSHLLGNFTVLFAMLIFCEAVLQVIFFLLTEVVHEMIFLPFEVLPRSILDYPTLPPHEAYPYSSSISWVKVGTFVLHHSPSAEGIPYPSYLVSQTPLYFTYPIEGVESLFSRRLSHVYLEVRTPSLRRILAISQRL